MQMQKKRVQKLITFSPQLYAIVKQKADRLGVSFPEYLRMLAVTDVKKEVEVEKIPMVDEETEKRIGESLKDFKEGRYTVLETHEDVDKHFKKLLRKRV